MSLPTLEELRRKVLVNDAAVFDLMLVIAVKDAALRIALDGTKRTTNDLNMNTVQEAVATALAFNVSHLQTKS